MIMYSPKIKEEYIPIIYRIAKDRGIPMTHIVREALDEYLNKPKMILSTQKGERKNDC
jgi:hypothetical protein